MVIHRWTSIPIHQPSIFHSQYQRSSFVVTVINKFDAASIIFHPFRWLQGSTRWLDFVRSHPMFVTIINLTPICIWTLFETSCLGNNKYNTNSPQSFLLLYHPSRCCSPHCFIFLKVLNHNGSTKGSDWALCSRACTTIREHWSVHCCQFPSCLLGTSLLAHGCQ